jgi:phage tail-like protein
VETPVGSNRFYVTFDKDIEAVFTDASGLQIETEMLEHIEGGNNFFVHKLPGRTKISNVTLKSGMTVSKKLFNWYRDITQGKIKRKNMTIEVFDHNGKFVCKWEFRGVIPIKWVGPQLSAGANAMAIETLEFAHEGFTS